MAHQYILTIDVGTSGTKTAVWDECGRTVCETTIANPLYRPEPVIAEIDGNLLWQVVCQSIRQVVSQAGIQSEDIVGIGVDGVGLALAPVDRNVSPLAPVTIWLDRRASDETAWLRNLPEAQHLINLVANPLDESYVTPKLVWLQKNHPEIFENTYKFLGSSGYIVARLTGEFTCDFTQAYAYHFFDVKNEKWDAQAASVVGVPLEKMPRLFSPVEVVGTVTNQVTAETGLRAGIPVIAGCLDATVGALGAGVTNPGQTNDQGGQAGGFGISLEEVVVEPRLVFSHHAVPGQYLLAASTVGGGMLRWFRDQLDSFESPVFKETKQNPFSLYSLEAAKSPPGANGLIFLPYMAGERTPLWSNVARGVFFGLSYSSTRADILRAIMEGCAFAVYDNLHIAEEHGVTVTEFLGSGGATKSAAWCQIKADVYGRPFIVAQREDGGEGGGTLGLFALTAHAVGLYGDIKECVNSLLPKRRMYEPSLKNHELYKELFQVYHSVSRKLLDDFNDLDRIRRKML
jgi:xylulokinase